MKLREDFVTNSSSSSYVVVINKNIINSIDEEIKKIIRTKVNKKKIQDQCKLEEIDTAKFNVDEWIVDFFKEILTIEPIETFGDFNMYIHSGWDNDDSVYAFLTNVALEFNDNVKLITGIC